MGYKGVVALAALLLGGCEQGGHVAVTGSATDLQFAIVDGAGRPGCADSVSVTPAAPDDAAPLWEIIAVDPAQCVATVRYGVASNRMTEQMRAAPLRPGVLYRVRMWGAGLSAVQEFRLAADGTVSGT